VRATIFLAVQLVKIGPRDPKTSRPSQRIFFRGGPGQAGIAPSAWCSTNRSSRRWPP
jgi:hypothetical protein